MRTNTLKHCATRLQPYLWSIMSNTPLPKRLPPKLPMDCMLFNNPRCLCDEVRMAKASVAMSCVAEAIKASRIMTIKKWKDDGTIAPKLKILVSKTNRA